MHILKVNYVFYIAHGSVTEEQYEEMKTNVSIE